MQCIIPSSKLDEFKCSECWLPMSVGPIRVKPDGKSVCGRCYYENNPDHVPLARNYAYEAAAEMYLFPCIFQASGCPTHISFNDTKRHEIFCPYRTYNCPLEPECTWSGIVKELPDHYLRTHPELHTENNTIGLKLQSSFSRAYLLYYKSFYFLLQIKNAVNNGKLWIKLIYLGNPDEVSFIKYSLKVGSIQAKSCITVGEQNVLPYTCLQTDFNNDSDLDLNGVLAILKHPSMVTFRWIINIQEELGKKKLRLGLLQCPSCENYMAPPIYECNNNHSCCADCKGFEMDCIRCKRDGVVASLFRAMELEKLTNDLELPCRWKGCTYKTREIRQHEQECMMRMYKCPFKLCEEWQGSIRNIVEHLKASHPQCNVHVASDVFSTGCCSGSFDYIIAHGEVFLCHLKESDNEGGLLQLYYKGLPSSAGCFRYEFELTDASGKITSHELSRFIKNRYEVRVPLLFAKDARNESRYRIKIVKYSSSFVNMCLK